MNHVLNQKSPMGFGRWIYFPCRVGLVLQQSWQPSICWIFLQDGGTAVEESLRRLVEEKNKPLKTASRPILSCRVTYWWVFLQNPSRTRLQLSRSYCLMTIHFPRIFAS